MEHIEEAIAGMAIIPDFGFENNVMDKEDCRGWDLFRDFITADYKYERLENYIEARRTVQDKMKLIKQQN